MSIQQRLTEACVATLHHHGDTFQGAGYTKSADNARRCYSVMRDLIRPASDPVTIVDLGCGLGHFYEFLRDHGAGHDFRYVGIDLSADHLAICRAKYPGVDFRQADVLVNPDQLPQCDYVVMNGLFNYRGETTQDEMVKYFHAMLQAVWPRCSRGMAFNVMSRLVDWERQDLFHLSFDEVATFVWGGLSRHVAIRQDYAMYEFTTYVYREPLDPTPG
jgi:SAM-dependent methyltransferase